MIQIGSVSITTPVMNAACSVAKTLDDVQALAKTDVGAVMVGSITVEPRQGNPEPRWFAADTYALNSFGMPNEGAEFYRKHLPEMVAVVHDAGKKFVLSIAGFSTAEFVSLAKIADDTGVDLLELNFGCPNVTVGGKQKPIVSFDPTAIKEIVSAVGEVTDLPLMTKLSPYSNPSELSLIAETINSCERVGAVVLSNTFPNGYQVDQHANPMLANKFGGVSGPAMLPIALGQVRQFRDKLSAGIVVVGVGGIETAADAAQYFESGASMVQCATLIVRDGHEAINRVITR